MVGRKTFPGNPYDGHILSAQLEQTNILLEDVGRERQSKSWLIWAFGASIEDNPQAWRSFIEGKLQVADQAAAPMAQSDDRRWNRRLGI
jgi:hypothetical protein